MVTVAISRKEHFYTEHFFVQKVNLKKKEATGNSKITARAVAKRQMLLARRANGASAGGPDGGTAVDFHLFWTRLEKT